MTLSNQTSYWRNADAEHFMHPFSNYSEARAEGGARIITGAKGSWLTDSEGNRVLDGMAGLWCVNLGYGQQELAEAGYEQLKKLAYYNAFFKTATPPAVELAERLSKLAPPSFNKVFFGSSGSESNDTVIRMVRTFWQLNGEPERKVIIGRNYGYHGSTVAAAAMGGMGGMHAQGGNLPDFEHIMCPYSFELKHPDESSSEFGLRAANALEEKIQEIGPHKVAAFMAEPIQGAGGLIFPPDSYWPRIQEICDRNGILLCADEVISGFGRLGEWFAHSKFGIRPDTITLAKGITSGYQPLSAVLVGDRIANTFENANEEFVHGYTYSGHPVACAVALKNLEVIERDGVLDHVKTIAGPHLKKRLIETFQDHPHIGEVRCDGMLAALELVKHKETGERFAGDFGTVTRDECFKRNLIMRAVRHTMILSPVLTITTGEIDELVERARTAINAAVEIGLNY